jgi:hypothetical protein
MPSRARADPLPDVYRVIINKGDHKPWQRAPTLSDEHAFARIHQQTVTSFGEHEKAHPVNFFEQVLECEHCGCWRSPTTTATKCCQGGGARAEQKSTSWPTSC